MAKVLRVFGHPLHALLSDIPVALLGTSLLWDAAGWFRHESLWWAISFWNVALGLAAACLAAVAGLIDYSSIPDNDPALSTGIRHMVCMGSVLVLYGTSLVVRRGPAAPVGHALIAVLALEAGGLFLLSLGGWFGGHLVFHHGIGRDRP
jgi:uncharacterized membrane protein